VRAASRLAAAGAAALLAVPAAAGTVCVSPTGGGACRTTIQGGVDAAGAGDVVSIAAGMYFENVVIPSGKDGLQLVGASRLGVILDADHPNTGDGITIQSPKVIVRNLTIRNGRKAGIRVEAPGALLTGLRIVAVPGAIQVLAGQVRQQILLNEIVASSGIAAAVSLEGGNDDSVIKSNLITRSYRGIDASGDRLQVLSNRIVVTAEGGIVVRGKRSVVTGNSLEQTRGTAGFSLEVSGENPKVEANRGVDVLLFARAVCAPCTGGSFSANMATGLGSATVGADAPGFIVERNRVAALFFEDKGIRASLNSVSGYLGIGFFVSGAGHSMSRNTATRGGFVVQGDDITLDSNSVSLANAAGFSIEGDDGQGGAYTGIVLTNNKATGSNGEGFAILDGAGVQMNGNSAARHRVDACGATGFPGNSFGVTSATCDVIP
jgi:hypothetical protein